MILVASLNLRLRLINFKMEIKNFKLGIINFKMEIKNIRLKMFFKYNMKICRSKPHAPEHKDVFYFKTKS